MTHEFIHLLNFVLVSRLVYVFSDSRISMRLVFAMFIIQILGLLTLEISLAWCVLACLMIGQVVLFHQLENRFEFKEGIRSLSLGATIILLSIFFSSRIHISFNPAPFNALVSAAQFSLLLEPLAKVHWGQAGSLLMGFLLVLNEANLLLRTVLRRLDLAPHRSNSGPEWKGAISEGEFNTGRIIGMLERTIIFVAVLNNEIAAIGLVLGAKAFTRFKEFENREFAEYVLIGTLTSAFVAVAVALVVKAIVPAS